jgi:hypothetical protein
LSPSLSAWRPWPANIRNSIRNCKKMAKIEIMHLVIPEKQGAMYTVPQLNSILANNLVPNWDWGHLRTFTTLQWESDEHRGRPKARCVIASNDSIVADVAKLWQWDGIAAVEAKLKR